MSSANRRRLAAAPIAAAALAFAAPTGAAEYEPFVTDFPKPAAEYQPFVTDFPKPLVNDRVPLPAEPAAPGVAASESRDFGLAPAAVGVAIGLGLGLAALIVVTRRRNASLAR
jgi:hypothetical protein